MSTLHINGRAVTVEAEHDTPLLWVLREHLGLTGTKFGCGLAACGACTVHIDGKATRSCAMPAPAAVTRKPRRLRAVVSMVSVRLRAMAQAPFIALAAWRIAARMRV